MYQSPTSFRGHALSFCEDMTMTILQCSLVSCLKCVIRAETISWSSSYVLLLFFSSVLLMASRQQPRFRRKKEGSQTAAQPHSRRAHTLLSLSLTPSLSSSWLSLTTPSRSSSFRTQRNCCFQLWQLAAGYALFSLLHTPNLRLCAAFLGRWRPLSFLQRMDWISNIILG